jgi:hypothetical protein
MSGTDQAPGEATKKGPDASEAEAQAAAELDRILDEALSDTFPASDPISVIQPRPQSPG